MQKIHQSSSHKPELGIFLIIAFGVSTVFSEIIVLWLRYHKHVPLTVHKREKRVKYITYSLICGIGIAVVNQINMYLAGAMEAIIFYPVFNGSMVILTSVVGIIFWKEVLSVKQRIGLILGIASTLLLCMG